MSLQQSLRVVLVVEEHPRVAHCVEELLGMQTGEVVHPVEDLVVESQGPLELEAGSLGDFVE